MVLEQQFQNYHQEKDPQKDLEQRYSAQTHDEDDLDDDEDHSTDVNTEQEDLDDSGIVEQEQSKPVKRRRRAVSSGVITPVWPSGGGLRNLYPCARANWLSPRTKSN